MKKKSMRYLLMFFLSGITLSVTVNGQNLQQIVLGIENETFTDEAFFLFIEDGLTGTDPYDAYKLYSLSSSFSEIYSHDAVGNKFLINTLPKNLQQVLELSVSIRATVADTFKVSVSKFENIPANWTVSLVNLNAKDTISLNNSTSLDVIHSGTFQSGVLTVQHFKMIINPGIVAQKSSLTGTVGKDGWRFLGSSYSNISYAHLLDSVWTQGATSSDHPSSSPNIFTWNEASQAFEAVTDLGIVPGSGNGFIAYLYEDDDPFKSGVDGGWPKSFTTSGIAGFGSVNFPITYTSGTNTSLDGFNLVANPYPFPIDWNAPSGWTKSNMKDAIWIWDPNANSGNGGYLEHISGVGASINVIAPHQAFWVRANSANPVLTANESVKSSGGALLKQHKPVPALALSIRSEESGFQDKLYLSFRESETERPHDFNMSKLTPLSQDYVSLYSLFQGEKLAVNNFPNDFSKLEIPVQLEHTFSGEFILSLEEGHFFEDIHIQLLDKRRGRMIELNTLNDYTFYSDSATYDFTLFIERKASGSNNAKPEIPEHTELLQNYPNPFNPSTVIEFRISEPAMVTLEVFDMMGRKVSTLLNRRKNQGIHKVTFDASGLSSGMYMYRLVAGNKVLTKSLMLIK